MLRQRTAKVRDVPYWEGKELDWARSFQSNLKLSQLICWMISAGKRKEERGLLIVGSQLFLKILTVVSSRNDS